MCRDSLRGTDLVGRYGGDELVVLLPESSVESALETALRIRSAAGAIDEAIELQGLDLTSTDGLQQRWFSIADPGGPADASVAPHRDDPWWRAFTGERSRRPG